MCAKKEGWEARTKGSEFINREHLARNSVCNLKPSFLIALCYLLFLILPSNGARWPVAGPHLCVRKNERKAAGRAARSQQVAGNQNTCYKAAGDSGAKAALP